jgi:hypothetical protein
MVKTTWRWGTSQEKLLAHPLSPLLQPLGVTGGAEAPGLAGEGQKILRAALRTANPGEPGARIAAIQVLLHDFLDDRPEKPVLPLETGLILGQEPVEMMKQHPVEDRALRMAWTIDSRHIRKEGAKNGPGS